MNDNPDNSGKDDKIPPFGVEPLEFEDVDASSSFAPNPPPEDDEYEERVLHEEESQTRMEIESVLLGAMATDKSDKKTGMILNNLLTKAVTSATVSEEVGDLLTVDSFFDEADETQEKTGVEKVQKLEEKKRLLRVAIAKLLANLSEVNVIRKHMKKMHM